MSRGLEAFNRIMETYGKTNSLEGTYDDFLTIKKALQRLEAIDNANLDEALEDLKELHKLAYDIDVWKIEDIVQSLHIKQALIKAKEQEKVLSIIDEKNVDILDIRKSKTVDDYNTAISYSNLNRKELIQEEFDTLKEWVRNE